MKRLDHLIARHIDLVPNSIITIKGLGAVTTAGILAEIVDTLRAYYWRKYQEVSKYQHKRALLLTACKLVRLMHALLTKNESYVRPRTSDPDQEDDGLQ